MHNYNVDHKYKFQTRIGNWFEEWELDETKKKDYLKNRQNGQLASIVKDQKTHFSLRLASLTYPVDENVHFGFHIMLQNQQTKGFLSIDIQERLKIAEEAYNVTTAPTNQPTVRSVFVVVPYNKEPNYFGDDVLHYGQHFRIIANPRISNNKTFYLHSLPQTPTRCAKISRKQEVCANESDVFNTVWKLEHADPRIRFEMEGQPVKLSDLVLVKHSFTQHWLASDEIVYQNDFGREREVFVHSYQCLNKTQNLIAEKEGRTTIDIPLRNQEPQNLWKFFAAAKPQEQFDESVMDDNRNVKNLMIRVKQQIIGKGAYGLRGLTKIFIEMDQNKNGVVEYDDFKWGLRNFGLTLSEDETKMIFQTFDKNGNGKIEFNEFLDAFRLQMSDKRLYYVQRAYAAIEQKAGKVTLDTMGRLINVKEHPDVLKGYKTERQVFQEFVSHWNKGQPDKVITFQEFGEFYQDVSSSVQQDESFEAILKKSWNLFDRDIALTRNKYICPLYVSRNVEQNPPSDAYFQEEFKKPSLYRKTNWSQSDRFKMSKTHQGPSPASYEVSQTIGSNKPSCTIGSRIKPLATFQEKVPGSNTYEIKTAIVEPSRFNKIGLGYGNKSDFTSNEKTPGPGTYEHPSVFKNLSASILTNGTLRTNVMKS